MHSTRPAPGRALLIYVVPASVDLVLSLIIFVTTVRAAQMSGGALLSAVILTVWSLVYVVSCQVVGRLTTTANAHRLALAGVALLAATCAALAAAAAFAPMAALAAVAGVAAALFFPPFQVFMKDFDAAGGRPLAGSTGLYTFAWSTGYAVGPLVAGFLMRVGAPGAAAGERPGWRLAFVLGSLVCILIAALLAGVNRGGERRRTSDAAMPPGPAAPGTPGPAAPDFAWLGWIMAGAGLIASSAIRSIFPARALVSLRLIESQIGGLFFAINAAQALAGLAMTRSRTWMYRALPQAAVALAGLVGVACFGIGRSLVLLMAGAILFGVYCGAFYFTIVFFALSHPDRAGRYVAVNESVVGLSGVLGPLAAGAAADAFGQHVPYLALAGLIFLVTAFAAWTLARQRSSASFRDASARP